MDTPINNPGSVPPKPVAVVNPPAVPAATGATTTAAKPVATPTTAVKPGTTVPPKDQGKSNKRLLVGCLSAFGCSIFLFMGVLFFFLASGSTDNPIFSFLGVPAGEVVNVLLTLVNLIFLVLVFVTFILTVVGVFKITTARKDDKEARRRGSIFTFASLASMMMIIFVWVGAYFFLDSKRTITVRVSIATIPEKTINLTAPVTVKFDGSKAPINKTQFDILSYNWDFDDGTSLTGNPQTHTFTKIGNFKVKLTITVKEKSSGKEQNVEFTKDVTIQNVLANVVIKADKKTGGAPLTVSFDGSDSNSPNGELTAYAWDLDGDGEFDDAKDAEAQTTFDKIGSYKVGLRVTDSTGAFATAEQDIEVTPPDTPIAAISVEGAVGTELEKGKSYVFSAAQSASPTGTIEKYTWEFGDGSKAATRTANHTYKEAGEYDVILTVIDSAKKKGSITQRWTVKAPDSPPLVSIESTPKAANGIVSGQAPFDVIFDGSKSQDANDNIVEYAWDFDGDEKTDDANAVTSHKFTTAGTFNVLLTVTDSTNLATKSQVVVKVEAAGLKADIKAEPVAGVVPLTVKFDASGSSYPDGSIVAYEWNFGDGGQPRTDSAKVSHQYIAVGTFTAKVTAITANNKRASAQVPINVRPVPLKACFEPSTEEGSAPLQVEFDSTCSTGTVVKYRWSFANLSKSTERKPSFTFKNPGAYIITLEVADNENVVDTFTKTISVKSPE
ncbi:MAG: PKD domain-containing protein [Patescibacteria group bacterium]